VDLAAARDLGIAVFNAPFSNTRSVAEMVLAEAILLMRGMPEKSAVAHCGGWLKSEQHAFEVRGKTLGIVGYGAIGTQLSVLADGLGMKVIFFDVVSKLPLGNASQVLRLDDLLGQADVVSLHVPETAATRWMMGARAIPITFGRRNQGTQSIERLQRSLGTRGNLGDKNRLKERPISTP
jgi:D-3-phosphoglycerate dehydrogenase